MDSCDDTPKGWVAPFGHPRINACSRLPVAFRSVPRPSSPPGAKASTECPFLTRDHCASCDALSTMHRNHPQLAPGLRPEGEDSPRSSQTLLLSTQQSPLNDHSARLDAEASGQTYEQTRPETHQNLIHIAKDLGASVWRHLRHHDFNEKSSQENRNAELPSLLHDTFART